MEKSLEPPRLNVANIVLDYMLNWLALLLSVTTYSDNIISLVYGIVVPSMTLVMIYYRPHQQVLKTEPKQAISIEKLDKKLFLPKISYLTVYRSQMIIITAIAILAVDFNVFPRRFAKCETYGTSLMDLGVGSFVFSMGIVSARQSIWSKFNQRNLSFVAQLRVLILKVLGSFNDSLVVFGLGIGRLILVKLINYQEHVSEYGVHWNFFVTLSLLQPSKYILEFFFSILHLNNFNIIIGLVISIAYEYLLQRNDNQYLQYLLSDQQSTMFDQNKQGISSLVGYISIFLVGESVGGFLLPSITTPFNLLKNSTKTEIASFHASKNHDRSLHSLLRSYLSLSSNTCLALYTLFFDFLMLYSQSQPFLTPVSRRFANFQYVLFVVAYNLNFLIGFKFINTFFAHLTKANQNISHSSQVPYSLEAINNNGLAIFLVSNVLTGLINIFINTLDASSTVSVGILIGYTVAVDFIAILLHYRKIYIKI